MHGVDLAEQTRVDEGEKEEVPVSAEEEKNKALVRHLYEEQAKGNLDVIDEVLATDFVDHDRLAGQEPDREGYKWAIAQYNAAFSGLHLVIEDQLAAGEKVVTRFALSGTHQGELRGFPPTNNPVEVTGTITSRFAEGKIVEEWNNIDSMGMMQQLGIVPPLAPPQGA